MADTEDIRQQVIKFAERFPTPSVQEAVRLAEAGWLTWEAVYGLFQDVLATVLAEAAETAE